ncbi:MAG: SbcC/MukB-like Walker B domain-containing protein, partial [Thermoleophilaceae bacterium]
ERRGEAQAACAEHAASVGLPAGVDEPAMRALREATQGYRHAVTVAVRASADWRAARDRAAELATRLDGTRAALAELTADADRERTEARRLAAERREREAALGSSGLELRNRKRDAEERARAARAELERLQRADKDAGVALRDRERDLEHTGERLDAARKAREHALDAFRGLAPSGLFALGLDAHGSPQNGHGEREDRGGESGGDDSTSTGEREPASWTEAAGWTLTRALEAARALPLAELRAGKGIATLANRVERECAQLDRELAQRGDLSVVTQRAADGAIVVSVADALRERTLDELMGHLEREVTQRRAALSAEQSRVFGDALLEDIADHLRRRIARVEDLVADMNAALEGCPTASGRTVQLEWRPHDDGADLRALVRLLRRSMSTLAEQDRARLAGFLRGQIERARQDASLDGGDDRVAGHLRRAFDYREWFAFDLIELHGSERARLTRKRHAVGSGGEQAVLVHLPLFAAAAALYDSSRDRRAPRLIMLDEALSGIDDRTRERVMHALVRLDLDVVMTSHELWGTYRTVPQLAIYQLHRDNDLFGVFCEPFLWDGELLREGEQTELV